MINAMTIDVEDYFHVSALASAIPRSEWPTKELRVADNTSRLLDMFDEASVKATFFVLGWVADRNPEVVREISRRGHEIACHGWSHELVYNQERHVFRNEAASCKRLLEDITGQAVWGYRAASYSITKKSLWALDDLIDLGFQYDSSVFPIRHDRYGIPGAGRKPDKLKAPSGREIVEFPLTTAEIFGYRVPCSGGGYFRLLPFEVTRRLLLRVNTSDRLPFIFYLHPWEIDPRQPRIRTNWLSSFRHYTNLSVCAERLQKLLRLFQFGTVSQVLENHGLGPNGDQAIKSAPAAEAT